MDHVSGLTPAISRDPIILDFKEKLGVFPACVANAGPSARKKPTVMRLAVKLLKVVVL